MSEYVTDSGLVVTDRRHNRSTASVIGNGSSPAPVMTPTTFNGQAITPPPVVPWAGWPVEWAAPSWGGDIGLVDMISRVSVVFGCIDLNSSILSTMPPYRLVGDDHEVADPLPWMRNPQPEVYTGWTEAMKQVFSSYWGGEAFIWATSRYSDGSVRNWVMLNPEWVDIDMVGQTRKYWLGESGIGPEITDDLLHLRYSSWPGVPHGIGPLEALATNLFGVEAMEYYQSNLAMRGGIPWGVLTSPGNLTQPQAEDMRERFVSARMSALGAPAVLSGGVTLTPFTISPKDMALLELRQFDEARITTLLGVPPTLMGLPSGDSMTYRNAEAIYDFHWRAYLRPRASAIMEAISNWALPGTQTVELNRDEYVRPSFENRVKAYDTLFKIRDEQTGERAITIEEIREAERMSGESEGGDAQRVADLIAIGAPRQAIWEAAGVSAEQIARWNQMAEEEQLAQSRATAISLGGIEP